MDMTITAGLRYEWWESSDRPKFNQAFADATNGLRNDANLDGIDLLMPRVGVTWGIREDLTLRGGVGLYSGGNPNVWLSNAWSNDGVTNAQFQFNYFDSATVLAGMGDSLPLSGAGRPGYDVPQEMFDAVANVTAADANDSNLALIDPNYETPSEWKYAIGGTWDTPWSDIVVDFDYLHTRGQDGAYYKDVSQSIVGTTAAGSPIYDYFGAGEDNLMLTNSGRKTESNMVSVSVSKEFEFGLSAQIGYAYVEGEDISPMVASTAGSNFTGGALLDINDPEPGNSNWVVPKRLTANFYYENQWFGENSTRISLQGYANEGQPQTFVMESDNLEGDGFNDRHLLYVPTGPSDPNVVFDAGFDQAAFAEFVARNGLQPGFNARNEVNTGWSTVWNLSVRQDVKL